MSSFHLCIDSSPGSLTLHNKITQAGLRNLSGHVLPRTRLHYGSDMERQYQLRTFGIPLDNFPVDKSGNIKTEINAWCDEYLENVIPTVDEQAPGNDNVAPHRATTNGFCEMDVLLGRGQVLQYHAGNVRFRKFLEEHFEVYDSMPRNQRMAACVRYTQELLSSGTGFLRQTDTQLWIECDFDQAVDKVAQFFRTHRRNRRLLGK